ncbi:MAG: anaerobic ribonucleoside triphosphate reductase [Ignisphaera sp.]
MGNHLDLLLEKYGEWSDFKVLENANRYPGPTGYFSMIAELALEEQIEDVLPNNLYKLHVSGSIYIHKLPFSLYIPYCVGHSIRTVLSKGLKTPTVISRPAKHFDTFVDHITNFLITMQHYFTGAQALSSVEWYAAPFIRADKLSFDQVKQHVQRLIYNLNYPTRIGLQSPFTNFTITMDAPKRFLKSVRAIYGGSDADLLETYEDEAKLFVKALAKLLLDGDSISHPFTFPIPTLMATSKWIWEDPEIHELVFKVASKRGSFYWLNTNVVDPDGAFAMCCRIVLDREELNHIYNNNKDRERFRLSSEKLREEYWKNIEKQRFGGVWSVPDSTGSVNVVDINLPRLALESQREESRFWELYDETLLMAKLACEWFRDRYIYIMNNYPSFYSMIVEYIPEFPQFHFNTIGLVGLPEAVAILMQDPKLWIEGSLSYWLKAADLMRKIVEFAVQRTRRWMIEESVPWNVEEVPGESAASKLALKDIKMYPELAEYLPDPENPIYSTSIAPYYAPMELYERVEVEQKVQKYFTGGVMMHIFLDEEPDPESLASLTKKLLQTELVYWSYTPAITLCPRCGKDFTGLHTSCPRCGSDNVEIWSRIVGYYRPLKNWNPYRKREFWMRKHYKSFAV